MGSTVTTISYTGDYAQTQIYDELQAECCQKEWIFSRIICILILVAVPGWYHLPNYPKRGKVRLSLFRPVVQKFLAVLGDAVPPLLCVI
jgi:hypothetical protein